jgi:hypothetical protein
VNGKTVAESFASPAAFQMAQAEIHEYQRLQKLCADLVAINEHICRLRPLQKSEKWSADEKNGCCGPSGNHARIRHSTAAHFAERRKAGELDIEAVEFAFRTALHSAGAAGLTELLCKSGTGSDERALRVRRPSSL